MAKYHAELKLHTDLKAEPVPLEPRRPPPSTTAPPPPFLTRKQVALKFLPGMAEYHAQLKLHHDLKGEPVARLVDAFGGGGTTVGSIGWRRKSRQSAIQRATQKPI